MKSSSRLGEWPEKVSWEAKAENFAKCSITPFERLSSLPFRRNRKSKKSVIFCEGEGRRSGRGERLESIMGLYRRCNGCMRTQSCSIMI